MADSFQLSGSYITTPSPPGASGSASFVGAIQESLSLTRKDFDTIVLDSDAPLAVNFGSGVTEAAVVLLKATGGKVRARLTSADGSQQAVPVDDLQILVSQSVPFTAIDLTRVPGVLTSVDVFLGQTT